VRVVAVAWIQSYVKDPARRELLYELETVLEKLAAADPRSDEAATLDRVHCNLTRMWVEA
jgi:PKHD-type hydroxylase